MSTLILLRHGQSTWNDENRFTGWVDVDLTPFGEEEARQAGKLMAAETGLNVDVAFTSLLTRAIRSCAIALDTMGRSYIPVTRHWRLNERHYGALQGLDKKETSEKYGAAQIQAWRRGYSTPPDPVSIDDPNHPVHDARYADVPRWVLPATECLADVVRRLLPYYEDEMAPRLIRGATVLVVAHGNSLRAMVKHLEGISDDDITELEIPTGVPRVYELDDLLQMQSVRELGDASDIAARTEAVARQTG